LEIKFEFYTFKKKLKIMKDTRINHISEVHGEYELEIIPNDDETITLCINHISIYEPSQCITFTKEGIADLIHDLNQVL